MGGKIAVPAAASRGWNEWAGDGIKEQKFTKNQERVENLRKAKIEELKKKRADTKMKGVVLNVEDRDKKFA